MKTPLVSIIIPVYKVEPFLDECIQSIVGQTYKNLEIILVNDGSPDNCPTKCDEWAAKDERIIVVHKKTAVSPTQEMRVSRLPQENGSFLLIRMMLYLSIW